MQKNNQKFVKTAREPWDFFHDCHICQGMKQGRGQTMDDLKKLFAESAAKQGMTEENKGLTQ